MIQFVLDLDCHEPGLASIHRVDHDKKIANYCYMTIVVHMDDENSNPKLLARAERIVAALNDAAAAGKDL